MGDWEEGVVLDSSYTGRALVRLIDLVRKGRFRKKEVVAFVRTSGIPGLFAADQIAAFQRQ